jgi:hypothetical protein
MNTGNKRPFLAFILSVAFALLTLVVATFFLLVVHEAIGRFLGQAVPYLLYDLVIAIGCFFIIRQNTGSIWYVPIISNAIGILIVIVPGSLGTLKEYLLIYGGLVLSLIVSIIARWMGKRAASHAGN